MSACASLIGLECAECRRKGHHCQAEIIGDEALCMRCADGEPCCAVTALAGEDADVSEVDPFVVPNLPKRSVYAPREVRVSGPLLSGNLRGRILRDLESHTLAEVANWYRMDASIVERIQLDARKGKTMSHAERLQLRRERERRQARERKARTPVLCLIAGEPVHMAPMAVMGAEPLNHEAGQIAIRDVLLAVSEAYGLTVKEMLGRCRKPGVLRPRQIAMYLAKNLTGCEYSMIGRLFGNMHHTTVIHSVTMIEKRVKTDVDLAATLELLAKKMSAEAKWN